MSYQAKLNYARITPRKLRLVVDLIRGKKAVDAQKILRYSTKRAAAFIYKLLNSAIANATVNPNVTADNLYVAKVTVGCGPIIKRWRSAPQGRAVPIKKRTSHTTLVLDERTTG
ncbi:MAG: 50S ribosomal protein L22 [Planctomycetes bacterium]|nr:50S ribosomal protein L22 [Planctomycetota bacterium]